MIILPHHHFCKKCLPRQSLPVNVFSSSGWTCKIMLRRRRRKYVFGFMFSRGSVFCKRIMLRVFERAPVRADRAFTNALVPTVRGPCRAEAKC